MNKEIEIPESYEARIGGNKVILEPKESEDEKIRKALVKVFEEKYKNGFEWVEFGIPNRSVLDWLEKQKESLHISKTSKENADSFTDEDEKIRSLIYQLIRDRSDNRKLLEHNGVSVENALAWLERQKEHSMSAEEILTKAGLKPFKDGNQWCILAGDNIQVGICGFGDTIEDALYQFLMEVFEMQKEQKPEFYPGDVIKCTTTDSLWIRCKGGDNIRSDGHTACIGGGFELASEEEAVQFFQELNENGYQWDCIKGRPIKKEQKYSPLCNTVKDKIREYIANHFITDTVVKTDAKSIVKAMEEGVRLGKEEQKPGIDFSRRSWYMEGYHDAKFKMEPMWLIKTGEGGPKYEANPRYGQPLEEEQKSAEKQDYSGLNDLERAIHRGFLCAGFENVPAGIIKETAQDCLAQMKPAEGSDEDVKSRCPLNTKEIKVGDIVTYFRNGKKGIMLVSSFDADIYPRCKWGISDIGGTAYGNWAPGVAKYYAATEKEKQQLYDTMPTEVKDWLESLRPQPKQEWSEEDYIKRRALINTLRGETSCFTTNDFISWLKSLPERFVLQPKQEWGEKEQQIIEDAACALIDFSNTVETKKEEEELCKLASKLQDLKPQPQWKPSDEQLNALQAFVGMIHPDARYNAVLSLLHDLKNYFSHEIH